jgi:hypothetical protein
MARMQLPAMDSMRSIQGPTGPRFHVLLKIMLENEGQTVGAWVLLNEDAKAKEGAKSERRTLTHICPYIKRSIQ